MRKSPKFSPEAQQRAVRMVFDVKDQFPSQWAAIESIAAKIGCTAETLRKWVRQGERDSGLRPTGSTLRVLPRTERLTPLPGTRAPAPLDTNNTGQNRVFDSREASRLRRRQAAKPDRRWLCDAVRTRPLGSTLSTPP